MSEITDFSKRRFADFVAARLIARRIERDEQSRSGRNPGHVTSLRAEDESACAPNIAEPGLRETSLIKQSSHPIARLGSSNFGILALALATMLAALEPRRTRAAALEPETARVPLLNDEDAWKRLPAVVSGGGQRLPAWARALAGSLPRTTAAMLDLDRIHRTKSPLGPLLRGKMRWVAARANHLRRDNQPPKEKRK